MSDTKRKVMIIDDDQSILFLSKAIIASSGYEVITEADSTKALAAVKEQKPDLILMDLVMPNVNGVELAKEIRENPELKTSHIFAFTGTPMVSEQNDKYFEKIILKPYQTEELLAEINTFFASLE